MVAMKLLLFLLLTVSSVSVKKSSQQGNIPGLEVRLPEITAHRSTLTFRRTLPPASFRQKRQSAVSSSEFNYGRLKWQTWDGSLPNGTVSINNEYAGRVDYVCKYLCHAGFFHPDLGPYCYYTYKNEENRVHVFEILVNEHNSEILEWKEASGDSVPEDSIRTCSSDIIYVGKNKYGLGKVHLKDKVFYLPWKGSQYSYSSYQVLTVDSNVASEHISNVTYITDMAKISLYPPETMRVSVVNNSECNPVSQTANLTKTIWVEHRWDLGSPIRSGMKRIFTSGLPSIVSRKLQVGPEVTFHFPEQSTVTQEFSQSVLLNVKVPPNHTCRATMVGINYKVDVPYTAHVSRTYGDGKTTLATISGTYDSVQLGEVHSTVDRCEPVPDAKSCS